MMQFDSQLTVVDSAIPASRQLCGYISELTAHGTGPIPEAKKNKYKIIPKSGIQDADVFGQNSSDQKESLSFVQEL